MIDIGAYDSYRFLSQRSKRARLSTAGRGSEVCMAFPHRRGYRRTVCVLSSHPLVLRDLNEALTGRRFRVRMGRMDSGPLRRMEEPIEAPYYVVDAQFPRPSAERVVATVATRFPNARILVVAEEFPEREALALLGLGVKGLVRYADVREKLSLALDAVAAGGFWAPRTLLSRLLDDVVASSRGRKLTANTASVSVRERQVLEALLENLSNKEIAHRLHISERTVKFHVSNLLAKFRLKGRHDLILHCLEGQALRPVS
jgi:DNA-binding NarL/FixJ family response regulator